VLESLLLRRHQASLLGPQRVWAERMQRVGLHLLGAARSGHELTAEALAAVFEYVRDANSSMDSGSFHSGDVPAALGLLQLFDSVFDVLRASAADSGLPDAEVETLIAERTAAKKSRDFARADAIRQQLLEQGIILEDTKSGIRWKRK